MMRGVRGRPDAVWKTVLRIVLVLVAVVALIPIGFSIAARYSDGPLEMFGTLGPEIEIVTAAPGR